jgi:hypothetical protein
VGRAATCATPAERESIASGPAPGLVAGPSRAAHRRSRTSYCAWRRATNAVTTRSHALGHPRESQEALDALASGYARTGALQIAEVHAWRGERDRAFEWLERAYAQRDGGLTWLKTDPLRRGVRDDARFAALLRKLKLPSD